MTDAIPLAKPAGFPSQAAQRLGIRNAGDLRRAVVLAAVLDQCPGLSSHAERSSGRWNN